jgi:uncharacterized protein with HEPN domain
LRSDRERLLDILEAAERIQRHTSRGREVFESDELVQNWVISHLLVIGEACRAMTEDFKVRHAEIPFAQIVAMRHILVHQYFEIDEDIVWGVVERDLPQLRAQVENIVGELGMEGR